MRKLILLPCVIAGLLLAMAIGSAGTASANTEYWHCGRVVNNQNKCWGPGIEMTAAYGFGSETGVCVGIDETQGTCAPAYNWAHIFVGGGTHWPWIIGTSSNFTEVWGETN
jgi:hypothetical protein